MAEYSMLEKLYGKMMRAIGRVPLSEVQSLPLNAYLYAHQGLREPYEKQLNRLKELYGV